MLKVINVDELTPGMMITQVIEQSGPVKIRKVGLVKSADMITGLAEMGVTKVEIDTDQTIDIELAAPTSMTQKLLQGEYDHASQVDKSLSDQFNRSLFLPSVSELPSAWQIQLKQVGLTAVVVLAGLSLGFTAAFLPSWLTKPTNEPAQTVLEPAPVETVDQQAKSLPSSQLKDESEALVEKSDNDASSDESETMVADQDGVDEAEEGQIITQVTNPDPLPQVSPELLERFNKALQEIDNEPENRQPETTVTVVDDTPRIDQLPARTLTQLPSMTFSAHMYASAKNARWVRVNGKQLFEGEWLDNELQLIRIEPQRVILSFRGERFSMSALTDW